MFESAIDAIIEGNLPALQSLLAQHSTLVKARSTRPHKATLLHYLGANGVEDHRQKSPPNAPQIAAALLHAGAEVDALAFIYGTSTTLALVATSSHPQKAGVQPALINLLIDAGASTEGILDRSPNQLPSRRRRNPPPARRAHHQHHRSGRL